MGIDAVGAHLGSSTDREAGKSRGLPANRIAQWDGTNWSPLDAGLGGAVYALAFSTLNGIYRAPFDAAGTYILRLTASDYGLTN